MSNLSKVFQRKSVKYGIPFFLLLIGGSFGLKEFTQLRYTFSKQVKVRETIKQSGVPMNDPSEITLEKQYERLKEMNIDDWEQVRGPRPWEETPDEKTPT